MSTDTLELLKANLVEALASSLEPEEKCRLAPLLVKDRAVLIEDVGGALREAGRASTDGASDAQVELTRGVE